MTFKYRALIGGTGALTACLGLAVPAFADDAAAPQLEEIVVTAQKREQNVQSVPLSVQVIGQTQLAAAGIENFEDFNRVAPSLLVRTDVTPINATVAIRGIGTSAFGIGVEPSVAVVVDDVPLAFQSRAFGNMTDISRVEILAGPQSTLYGKSSTAGLVNIVTPDPTNALSGRVEATGTTDSERDVSAWLSGPITDTLAGRRRTADRWRARLRTEFFPSSIGRPCFVTARLEDHSGRRIPRRCRGMWIGWRCKA